MKRTACAFAVLATTALTFGAAAAPALATPGHARSQPSTACAVRWGTNTKQHGPTFPVATPVRDVRAGQHGCFDRLVVDLGTGPSPGYSVRYVSQILSQAEGKVLPVRGHAKIEIVVRGPAGRGYHPLAVNLVSVAGFATFRQVRGAGSFERVTEIGLGVRAKLPFRVFLLGSTQGWRLVIDVAH
jgi:hypothetical protein